MKLEASTRPAVAETATITFDKAELEFLATIMQHVGGDPLGVRGSANRLNEILVKLGYDWPHITKTAAWAAIRSGSTIQFDD